MLIITIIAVVFIILDQLSKGVDFRGRSAGVRVHRPIADRNTGYKKHTVFQLSEKRGRGFGIMQEHAGYSFRLR